jgi:hypothetical protein
MIQSTQQSGKAFHSFIPLAFVISIIQFQFPNI